MESQIREIHQQLVEKKITCTDLIQAKLDLLKPNAYNTVNSLLENLALEKAKKVDEKIKNKQEIGLLEGIPFGIKEKKSFTKILISQEKVFFKVE